MGSIFDFQEIQGTEKQKKYGKRELKLFEKMNKQNRY